MSSCIDETPTLAVGSESFAASRQRRRIAVETDQRELRVRGKQRFGVSAEAERRVDDNCRPARQSRTEQRKYAVEHYRDVRRAGGRRRRVRVV